MAEIKRRSEAFSRVGSPQRMMAMSASDNTRLADLRIAEVKPDPGNPRKDFAEAELADLAASLKAHGLLQPIVVRKVENDFIILAGERRWRAAQLAGFVAIKAIVHAESRTAANVLIAQVIENEQRAPLSTAELVTSVGRLLTEGMSSKEIGEQLSMSPSRISKLKALTELPEEMEPFLHTMGVDPLYELLQRHKADPASVQQAIESGKAPTRAKIREVKRPPEPAPETSRLPLAAPGVDATIDAEKFFAGETDPEPKTKTVAAAEETFAGETRKGQQRKRTLLPSYREHGSITVSHADYGRGRVLFGMETLADRLPILFTSSPEPIQIPLIELTIVQTD